MIFMLDFQVQNTFFYSFRQKNLRARRVFGEILQATCVFVKNLRATLRTTVISQTTRIIDFFTHFQCIDRYFWVFFLCKLVSGLIFLFDCISSVPMFHCNYLNQPIATLTRLFGENFSRPHIEGDLRRLSNPTREHKKVFVFCVMYDSIFTGCPALLFTKEFLISLFFMKPPFTSFFHILPYDTR